MTPKQRSHCMSRIRSANTKPEMHLRRALWAAGLRFRVRGKTCGRPDVVFTRSKLAVFVDGCFWHGCPVHGTHPKTNQGYWRSKIEGNKARDERVSAQLHALGWSVMRFWLHQLDDDLPRVVEQIQAERERR